MLSVVGLGNPGERYRATRHNLGFRVVDLVEESPLLLVQPTTFMNDSGRAAVDVLGKFPLELPELLVVLDDIHLELGLVRIRRQGSFGGHNGLQSIIDWIGDTGFPRIRLGIGLPLEDHSRIDYVLGEFDTEERKSVDSLVERAAKAVICWATRGTEEAMNRYNAV